MKRLAAALLLVLPLAPVAVHAEDAKSELTVLRQLRAKVVGKWINENGETLSFEDNGSLTMTSANPKLPGELKATYRLTPDSRLHLTVDNKTLSREYSVEAEALRLKTPTGEFVYTRFSKRLMAEFVLSDIRKVDAAIDQWAIEHNKRSGDRPTAANLLEYMPEGSRLSFAFADPKGPKDWLGNPYGELVVDKLPKVHPVTAAALAEVAPREFWQEYID